MTEVIAFDDAEALTIGYLIPIVTDAHISSELPDPLTGPVVTIQRVGGTRDGLVTDNPILIIQCWAPTKEQASDLCRLVRAHVGAMPGNKINGVWAYKVTEVGGPASFPDPDHEWARYQFTVQLRLRGKAI